MLAPSAAHVRKVRQQRAEQEYAKRRAAGSGQRSAQGQQQEGAGQQHAHQIHGTKPAARAGVLRRQQCTLHNEGSQGDIRNVGSREELGQGVHARELAISRR